MGQQANAAPAKPTAWTSLAQQQSAAQQQNAVANAGGAIGGAAAVTAASAAVSAAAAAGGNRNSTTDSFKMFQKAAKEKMDRQKLAQERIKAEQEKIMRYGKDVKSDPDVTMGNMDNNRQGTGGVSAGAGGATGGRSSVKQERPGGGGAPAPLLPK